MDNKVICDYLQKKLDNNENRLLTMDKRHKIPRKIKAEIKELKAMINFLNKEKERLESEIKNAVIECGSELYEDGWNDYFDNEVMPNPKEKALKCYQANKERFNK
jgi:aspartate ammonia-lyase